MVCLPGCHGKGIQLGVFYLSFQFDKAEDLIFVFAFYLYQKTKRFAFGSNGYIITRSQDRHFDIRQGSYVGSGKKSSSHELLELSSEIGNVEQDAGKYD